MQHAGQSDEPAVFEKHASGPGGGRVIFGRDGAAGLVAHRGLIYGPPPAGLTYREHLEQTVELPRSLNHLEADLAAVRREPDGGWLLVRDAFGQTPLFYSLLPDGFAWGFSLPDLFEALGRTPPPDEATLFDYVATHYRHIFRDPGRTFHQGVRQAPAGALVRLRPGAAEVEPWLDLSADLPRPNLSAEQASDLFIDILADNVRHRVDALPRSAFTISAGLDSSTVAALASRNVEVMTVFSVGYQGHGVEEYDETEGLTNILKDVDWRWQHLILAVPDLLAEVENLIRLTRAPVITATWLAHFQLAREAAALGFKYLWGGIGGDECLAGEYEHFFYFLADLKAAGEEELLERETAAWQRLHDHPVFRKNPETLAAYWARNLDFATGEIRVDMERYRANWRFFNPDWLAAHDLEPPPMPRPYRNFLPNRIYQELTRETTPPTLWGQDAGNRAVGLTGIFPFLSPRLFRLSLPLPGRFKYENGLTKALLRRNLGGLLPESTRWNHRKVGFNAPIDQWFRGPKQAWATLEAIQYGPLIKNGWLKPEAPARIFDEHQSGAHNHMMLLWALLNASIFMDLK